MFQQVPFIPIWKNQPLSLSHQEAMLALHVLRTFRNLRSFWQPEAKYHELSRPVSHLIDRLLNHLDSTEHQIPYRGSESRAVQLDTSESLLVWKALHEYSILRRHEVTQNTTDLIDKVQTYLTSPIGN